MPPKNCTRHNSAISLPFPSHMTDDRQNCSSISSMSQTLLVGSPPLYMGTCTICVREDCDAISHAQLYSTGSAEGYVRLTGNGNEMLDISRPDVPHFDPNQLQFYNIALHIRHSTGNLLYDGDNFVSSSAFPYTRPQLHRRNTCPIQPPPSSPALPYLSAPFFNSRPLSLLRGPAGYVYTPLWQRNMGFESLQDDHGIRHKRRVPFVAVVLHCRLLLEEDGVVTRLKKKIKKRVGKVKTKVEGWVRKVRG